MQQRFLDRVQEITRWLGDRKVEPGLGPALSAAFPPDGAAFRDLADLCRQGVAEGWLANRGDDPLKWGRAIKPSPDTAEYSIDVVHMTDVAGPYHVHPQGEIDMIVPLEAKARFDGHGEGWLVYGAGSAHAPTVSGGAAIVLYLLPGGEIDFRAS